MATRVSTALPRDLRYDRTPKRVRARLGGETLADSTAAILVWEPRRAVPVYAFPDSDVRLDLLRASEHPVPDAHGGGATFSTAVAGDEVAENAAWRYADPDLAGHLAFAWEAMDHWYEEEEEVFGHPRDPRHRVDARRSARHVRVAIGGVVVAESHRPTVVFETSLPTRWYLPRADVAMDRLTPTDTRTICAYKGFASYWSVGEERDVAWTYDEPLPDAPPIAGLVCFLGEKADIEVDGEPVERPTTQWSSGIRSAPRGGGSGARQGPHDDVGHLRPPGERLPWERWPATSRRSRRRSTRPAPRTPRCSSACRPACGRRCRSTRPGSRRRSRSSRPRSGSRPRSAPSATA